MKNFMRRQRARSRANRQPRLLLISPLPPPAGGVASWTQRITQSKLASQYEISVVDTNPGPDLGVNARKLIVVLKQLLQVVRALVAVRPDIVHINTSAIFPKFKLECGYMFLSLYTGSHVVMHLRGQGLERRGSSAERKAQAVKLLSHADRVFVLTKGALESLQAQGVEQVRQVRNFVMTHPAVDRSRRKFDNARVQFLYVGWIMKEKGIYELLEAIALVPNVHLTLLGRYVDVDIPNGTNKKKIAETLKRLKLDDRVTIPGEVPLEMVRQYYDNADVFVLPSHTEGLPNVLLESMMSTLPAVVTPVGAIPEVIVDNKTALVVPVDNIDKLNNAIATLSNSQALRLELGNNAYQRAVQNYSRDAVVDSICDLYDEMLLS